MGPDLRYSIFATNLCFPPKYIGAIFKFNRL